MSAATVRRVTCPACGAQTVYAASNPYRPFCSERCRTIDFGGWASERYRIAATGPGSDAPEDDPQESPHPPEDGRH